MKNKRIPEVRYSKLISAKNYFKPKKISDSGLILLFGNRGCGKSTYISKLYYDQYKLKLKGKCQYTGFYSNEYLSHKICDDFYHYIDLHKYKLTDYIDPKLSKYNISTYNECLQKPPFIISKNSYIAIDEIGILYNNRAWKSFPKELTNFIKLLRHYGIYLVINSQNYDIDKSLRNGCNSMYLMKRVLNFTILHRIKKYISVSDVTNSDNADSQIVDKVELCKFYEPQCYKLCFIPFYTDLFNSYE